MTRHRNRYQIIAEMLTIALDGATATRIMYLAYLSGAQFKEYLSLLQEKGLLERQHDGQWKTTLPGKKFLDKWHRMLCLVP